MYDFAEIRTATDLFWELIRSALENRGIKDLPHILTRHHDLPQFWSDPLLLLGQTCGYPLMKGLCGNARYVATPRYKTRFGSGAEHKSVIIARRSSGIRTVADAHGKVCAINMADSNTGMNLLRLEIAKLRPSGPFFSRVFETLAHRNSMLAVVNGKADIASIDCVTYALLEVIDGTLARNLEIIAETERSPSLPFITSPHTDDDTLLLLRDALDAVISDPQNKALLDSLMIDGIEVLPAGAYHRILDIENQAVALGYPKLH
jgi:ABC-type phosphate/phosphonate transport system substrate-binding protein